MSDVVFAIDKYRNNGELILAAVRLGYLRYNDVVLDVTYGKGVFWKYWKPQEFITHDLKTDGVDFRRLPEDTRSVDAHVIDGPYKLNGKDQGEGERYGVDVPATWQERNQLIMDGMREGYRVLKHGGKMLVKGQNQVCSGAVRWQIRTFSNFGEDKLGLQLVDQLDMLSYRKQPEGRRQVHARRNCSSLLIFRKP